MAKYCRYFLLNTLAYFIFDQMGKKSLITKAKIVETARKLFIEKGFDGVKMQELADKAGVNKGLLHHYFKSKESLFKVILSDGIDQLFGKIEANFANSGSLETKINGIVDAYFDMLIANPKLPLFVFFELSKNPENVRALFGADRIELLIKGLKKGNEELDGKKAFHIILTIVSLSVFPFMAKPIVMHMVKDETDFVNLIEERRPIIKSILKNLAITL